MIIKDARYVPLLSLKPAEMAALEELSNKEKDILLPLISLKRWANSKSLDNSLKRVEKAFDKRYWIADLDSEFLGSVPKKIAEGATQDVFYQFKDLSDSANGYLNWVNFIAEHDTLIPTAQLGDLAELNSQLDQLIALQIPVVIRIKMGDETNISPAELNDIVYILTTKSFVELLVILDYGDLTRINLLEHSQYSRLITTMHKLLPNALFSVSGTSFPYTFGRSYKGEIPIYERQIFNKIVCDCPDINLIYSDWGSTRELNINGGGGVPPPRIDYALKNDWRYIRKEFDEEASESKELLYKKSAIEMMASDYWINDLPAWGRQMIEKTALGDEFGITSAHRATAVRVNLHLYQQIHYFENPDEIDTEEDWVD